MAIGFGTGINGAATNSLAVSAPSVRKSESRDSAARSEDNESKPRVGFGEGTISALGVAAATVDQNLESVREIVPSFDELSADARARSEAVRESAANNERARLSTGSQRNEREARVQTQRFEQDVSPQADAVRLEHADTQNKQFTPSNRSVESIVSIVIPEPSASFDTFG